MDNKEQSDFEQGMAFLGESLPGLWFRLYENCIAQGFNESQAITLVRTYIMAQGTGDKKGQ